jgi:hypothetical protein
MISNPRRLAGAGSALTTLPAKSCDDVLMARWSIDEVPGLTEVERAWLKDRLKGYSVNGRQILEEDGLRITADDGYEIQTSGGWGGSPTELHLGRSGIHENLSIRRLRELEQSRADGMRGLFYPGATLSQEMLFQAALYFDEIFVINPASTLLGSWGFRNRYRHSDDSNAARYLDSLDTFLTRLQDFDKEVLPLKRAGVLRLLPPQMQERSDFVELITADMDDPEFREIVESGWHSPVFVASKKMESLLPLVGERHFDGGQLVTELQYRSRYANSGIKGRPELFSSDAYGVKEVEPALAASILLNHAFLLSEAHGLVPFTDDSMCTQLMQRKLQRIAELPGFKDFRRTFEMGATSLSVRVLEEYLPRFKFRNIEDVLVAREKLAEQLDQFRQAMAALSAEIEESPYDVNFSREVERILAARVKPAITALENEIKTSRDRFITRFIRNAQVGTVPVVGSIFAGLPASSVIAISAGVLTFEAAIETYMEITRKKRNGLTLLMKRH